MRITECEWEIRDDISVNRDIASDGVIICGNVVNGRDIDGIPADIISYTSVKIIIGTDKRHITFFKRFVASINTSVS